jgi:hypothetical protein
VIEHGVGDMPDELVDSELCEIYGWTWPELQATPLYVRRIFALIQQMKRAKDSPEPVSSTPTQELPYGNLAPRGT